MVSVIVPTFNSLRELQVLLPAMVRAAIDGVVRQVIAADAGSTDPTPEICEDAGVLVVQGGIVAAARSARSERLLIVPSDLDLAEGWEAPLARHLQAGGGPALLMGARGSGWRSLLNPRRSGLLTSREAVAAQPEDADLDRLRRVLGAGAPRLGR